MTKVGEMERTKNYYKNVGSCMNMLVVNYLLRTPPITTGDNGM